MALRSAFDVLSELVERCEANGRELRSVEVSTDDGRAGTLSAEMEVPVSLCEANAGGSESDLTPAAATVTEGGGLCVEFAAGVVDQLTEPAEPGVSATVRGARVGDEGELLVAVGLHIDPANRATGPDGRDGSETVSGANERSYGDRSDADRDREEQSHEDPSATEPPTTEQTAVDPSADPTASPEPDGGPDPSRSETREATERGADGETLDDVRDDSVPPYEDTPYLRRLYETCDTFVEMSEEIPMDVASETVRRYMIEAGVHDPTSYDTSPASTSTESLDAEGTAADGGDPGSAASTPTMEAVEAAVEEQVVVDGVALPDGLEVTDVVDAVVESATLFEVQRRLELDRKPTQELLDQLDLLDLVLHRVSEGPKRQVSHEEVTARIRQCQLTGA
ncbi:hypothetical protein SAMN04487947_3440 [Halogeometricum rufum]|uniref:Uncharacterized protein n=2 Tax=Halogeometricum TaxID=60846 RepID=A0A1I6ILE9_9EURY|nr:hypothetical protein [Halogeometricum rufum]SFR67565.1 hypothetical protein SAMN04487947_3440 [Halogeometricum rufum]